MNPYAATIAKKAAVYGAAAGILLALAYFTWHYVQLRHALTLRMIPPQLP
jgi:hypothetical protein